MVAAKRVAAGGSHPQRLTHSPWRWAPTSQPRSQEPRSRVGADQRQGSVGPITCASKLTAPITQTYY
eukprot:6176712-Pleurochrysis_carterae.AAC.4